MFYRKKFETVKQVMGGKISEADRSSAALFYTEWRRAASLGLDKRRKPGDGRTGRGSAGGAAREGYWLKTVWSHPL